MKQYKIIKEDSKVEGTIHLDGSKSLSNRVLIIQALCKESFHIEHCSKSDDSTTLKKLLSEKGEIYDAHHAGTTFRFLCSYLTLQNGDQILTGSERMKERPIGALVDALRKIGAPIEYLGKEGYPPLKIGMLSRSEYQNHIEIPAGISSQFISSLLLIAPCLPKGLKLTLVGDQVSRPYLEMTLKVMEYFGINHQWKENTISIENQEYKAKDYTIEADWSAASYYYTIAAIAEDPKISLLGLFENSLQGDSAIMQTMEAFGIQSKFEGEVLLITKKGKEKQVLDHDFIKEPDTAQSVAVACAGAGKPGIFTGLKTLRIKETDRIDALQRELKKIDVAFVHLPSKFSKKSNKEYFMIEGQATKPEEIPHFDTYKDHRMAMSFGPLALCFPIIINEPDVVSKSYPDYWNDLESLGFKVELLNSH